jgi:hypothetical protein
MADPTFESLVQPFVAAIAPVVDGGAAVVDAVTQRARDVGTQIVSGIGVGLDTLGIDENDLKQLAPEQLDGLGALSDAMRQLRADADVLRGMVSDVQAVVRKPLAEKFRTENLAIIAAAAQQLQRVMSAMLTIFRVMKPLVSPYPTIVASVRSRFASFYDVA